MNNIGRLDVRIDVFISLRVENPGCEMKSGMRRKEHSREEQ
jgi:hypothetical protein